MPVQSTNEAEGGISIEIMSFFRGLLRGYNLGDPQAIIWWEAPLITFVILCSPCGGGKSRSQPW